MKDMIENKFYTLTNRELDLLALKAMGRPEWELDSDKTVKTFSAAQNIADAVEFANWWREQNLERNWQLQVPGYDHDMKAWWGYGAKVWSPGRNGTWCEATSSLPGKALATAVLIALEHETQLELKQ